MYYDSKTKDGEEQIDDVGGIVFTGYSVTLLTELVCPVVAVDIAGQEAEEKGDAAAGIVIFAGCLIDFVGETDEPVDGVYSAGYK